MAPRFRPIGSPSRARHGVDEGRMVGLTGPAGACGLVGAAGAAGLAGAVGLVGVARAGIGGWLGEPWRQRGTQAYLAILSATSLWAARHHHEVVAATLYRASTNFEGLAQRPVAVMVNSAFWIDPTGWRHYLGFVAVAVGLLAPLEHRLGTPRWLAAFATGHVGATPLNAAGMRLAVGAGLVDPSVGHAIDVGWSYGAFGLAAAGTWVLPERHRLPYALAVEAAWLLLALPAPTFTDFGHGLALLVGFLLGPELVRGRTRPAEPADPVTGPGPEPEPSGPSWA